VLAYKKSEGDKMKGYQKNKRTKERYLFRWVDLRLS